MRPAAAALHVEAGQRAVRSDARPAPRPPQHPGRAAPRKAGQRIGRDHRTPQRVGRKALLQAAHHQRLGRHRARVECDAEATAGVRGHEHAVHLRRVADVRNDEAVHPGKHAPKLKLPGRVGGGAGGGVGQKHIGARQRLAGGGVHHRAREAAVAGGAAAALKEHVGARGAAHVVDARAPQDTRQPRLGRRATRPAKGHAPRDQGRGIGEVDARLPRQALEGLAQGRAPHRKGGVGGRLGGGRGRHGGTEPRHQQKPPATAQQRSKWTGEQVCTHGSVNTYPWFVVRYDRFCTRQMSVSTVSRRASAS